MTEQLLNKPSQEIIEDYILSMKKGINPSSEYVRLNRSVLSRLGNLNTVTKEDIGKFLDKLRKPESEDPLHKWIGTYNKYLIILKKFFKWFGAPYSMEGFKEFRRKEQSIYKPTDLWTQEDDMLFLKYCPSVRDRCYHAISRDSSCRPSELLSLKIKDVIFKMAGNKQYAEILVNGKTGTRPIPLINSIPYLKDWLDVHPSRNNPNSYLIRSTKTKGKLGSRAVNLQYCRYKEEFFPQLLETDIPQEDKNKLADLLRKPWNPYIFRHSSLTDKSKILKENILRQHAGWTPRSSMHQKYIHYFGNESSESILEAYGLKPKDQEINKMQPVTCPNCEEPNKIDSRFCVKCRMVLSYDGYQEVKEEKESLKSELLKEQREQFEEWKKEMMLEWTLPKEVMKPIYEARKKANPGPWQADEPDTEQE